MELTPRQGDILRFIRRFRRQHGYGPTLEEIAAFLGISRVTVFEHVAHLRRKHMVVGPRGTWRGLDVSDQALRWLKEHQGQPAAAPSAIPLVGVIAAGQPLEAVQDPDLLDLTDLIDPDRDTFALQVRGDSMIGDHIQDGDYVIVRRGLPARDGQIVVALLPDGEATLKRLYREPGRLRLQPANPAMAPLYVTEDVTIQGVVIGVVRKYR